MSLPKISIIIPFYKVEDYIGRCLESIKAQSFYDFECILIDDGSSDATYEIANSVIKGDKRFRILRQENRGIGAARNRGLTEAVAEYICFLDSDDWWEKDFLSIMMQEAQEKSCDIVSCNYREVYEDNTTRNVYNKYIGQIVKPLLATKETLESPTVWNKLFKKSVWSDIFFPENIKSAEDLATLYKVIYRANRVSYIHDVLCNYFIRKDSLTRTYSERKTEDRLLAFDMIKKDIQQYNYEGIGKDIMYKLYYQHTILPTYFDIIATHQPMEDKKRQLSELKEKLEKKHFNYRVLARQKFLNFKHKIMLFDFLFGSNIMLMAQKIKRKYGTK